MRTGTVSYKLEDLKKGVIIPIGFEGENDFTRVIIDAKEVYKNYPNAIVSMKVQPPEGAPYPATVIKEENNVIWQVKAADVANRGGGELQLTFTEGETVIKTYIARTDIKRSLKGNGPAPDPVQDWIDDADEKLAEVEQALDDLAAMDNIAKTAQASDIGKALSPKTVEDGIVTEWKFITPGGGTEDYNDLENKPSIAGVTLSGDKTLEDLGIAAADDVDNLADDVSDVKTAIQGKQDAPSTAGTADQVMVLDDNLKPVWRTVPGVGAVTGDQISGNPIETYSENLIGEFTDGKYAMGISEQGTASGFSTATAEITGYSEIIISSYTDPSNINYPFVFYGGGIVQSTGGITEYETVGTKLYRVSVPTGADHVHVNVYTADKGSAVVKGIEETQKELEWLKFKTENIPNKAINPTQLVGEKVQYGGETPSGTSMESGYYTMKGKDVSPTFNNALQHFEVPVVPGMVIKTYIGANIDVIDQGNKDNYFCVIDENNKCTSPIDVTIGEGYIYTFRIPDNGETCYITVTGTLASAYVHAYTDEFKMEWLILENGNFKDNTIPKSAIIIDRTKTYVHGEVIEKPFDFNGKTVTAFGDSIMAGTANEGQGNYDAGSNKWASLFCTKAGATLVDNAVGGATIAYKSNEQYASVYSQVTGFTGQTDFIMIAGGTNDYNQGINVGQYGDNTQYTTYGALKLICEYLKTNYPTTPVIFITPINVMKDVNGIDKSLLNKYRNAIYEVATSYGFNVINGIDLVPVDENTTWDNEFIVYADGTHPTLKGHAMYYKNMCMKLL